MAAAVGALAGAHASIWRMHRDSIYQGFAARRFVGSVFVGALAAMAWQSALRLALPGPAGLTLLFGLTCAADRGIHESWKALFRTEDAWEPLDPMTFGSFGVRVTGRIARIATGIGRVIAIGLLLLVLVRLDLSASGPPTLSKSALVGLVAGLIIATGGALKHAPDEGFQTMRFIRSPTIAIAFALGLSLLTHRYLYLAVAAIGYERAVVETWKIFCAHVASRFRNAPWA
jgi:hypothetical protein